MVQLAQIRFWNLQPDFYRLLQELSDQLLLLVTQFLVLQFSDFLDEMVFILARFERVILVVLIGSETVKVHMENYYIGKRII